MDFHRRLQDLQGRGQKPPEFSRLREGLPPIPQVTAALAQVSPGPLASPSAPLREGWEGGSARAPRGAVPGLGPELVKPPQIREASPSAHFLRCGPGPGRTWESTTREEKGVEWGRARGGFRPQPGTRTRDSCRRGSGETGDARPERKQKPNAHRRAPGGLRPAWDRAGSPAPAPRPAAEPAPPRPGGRADTPGPGGRGGRERDGTGPRHARPKWATSGAAPRAGSPARARRRKRKRKSRRREEATPNRRRPLARPGLAAGDAHSPQSGAGPGAIPGAGRGRSGGPPTARLGRPRRPYPEQSRAARNADSATGRRGASRSGEARPAQAAAPLAPRCPAGGARGCTRGVGAREPPLPAPRACSRRTCLAPGSAPPGAEWTRGGHSGFHVGRRWLRLYLRVRLSPYLLPGKEYPKSWPLPAWPLPTRAGGSRGAHPCFIPALQVHLPNVRRPLDSSLFSCSFGFCNLLSDAPFPLWTLLHTRPRTPFQNKRILFSSG